jgi:ABC-2 type transport system ATP-binding protein
LFLDEPTVGMDIQSRQKLWQAIRHLIADGNSVVLTTHYLEEAEALADRVCVMARGRIISDGSVDALRARVALRRVRCRTSVDIDMARSWPEVSDARIEGERLCLSSANAEAVVQRLFAADATLSALEVHAAGLAEAFEQLTGEEQVSSHQQRGAI